MSVCVYPGSFDPMTVGHMDIIRRASALFDTIHVAVLHNPAKSGLLTTAVRESLLRQATADCPQVRISHFDGLLVDFARECGARFVVRGLRTQEDLAYEMQMAQLNRHMNGQLDTLFFVAEPGHSHISSNAVRQILSFGGDIRGMVPDAILPSLEALFSQTR